MRTAAVKLSPAPSGTDHVRGSLDAPVVITEFADFECAYCVQAFPVIRDIEAKYGDRLALVFRHFPLPMHPHAMDAAEAAEEAGAHGKFWEMHDKLFEHQQGLTQPDLKSYAGQLGLDEAAMGRALDGHTYRKRVLADRQSGEDSGVPGTPALFINGLPFEEQLTETNLSSAIDEALSRHS